MFILGILIAIIIYNSSASKEDLSIIRAQMDKYYITNELELINLFPYGFAIFTIDESLNVIPYKAHNIDCTIDWSTIKILKIENDSISMNLPNMEGSCVSPMDNEYIIRDNVMIIPSAPAGKMICLFRNTERAFYLYLAEDNFFGKMFVFGLGYNFANTVCVLDGYFE